MAPKTRPTAILENCCKMHSTPHSLYLVAQIFNLCITGQRPVPLVSLILPGFRSKQPGGLPHRTFQVLRVGCRSMDDCDETFP
jgi:hypothetical protein